MTKHPAAVDSAAGEVMFSGLFVFELKIELRQYSLM